MFIGEHNLEFWLECWARWCKRGSTGEPITTTDFSRDVSSGVSYEHFDEVELKIEVIVGRLRVDDVVAAEALRLDYLSNKLQEDKARLLTCSVATYRRKIAKAKKFVLEHVNEC